MNTGCKIWIRLLTLFLALVPMVFAEEERHLFLVSVEEEASPQDLTFLAAIPAACHLNEGKPVVIATGGDELPPEVDDFIERYKPGRIHRIQDKGPVWIAEQFWTESNRAVVCSGSDYGLALSASTLAARLKAPLLFCTEKGITKAMGATLDKLEVRSLILVHPDSSVKTDRSTTRLKSAEELLKWMMRNKLKVDYLAIANPRDRERGVIRKLSLTAPLFAAGREGALIPFEYETQWKIPFSSKELKLESIKTGDTVSLKRKQWSVSLFPDCAEGEGDCRLTYPCGEEIRDRLLRIYKILNRHPEYLCMVGMPDAIPFQIVPRSPTAAMDLPTDFPYGNTDEDLFVELALGRIIAENVQAASLYASRVLAYEDLLDPSWSNKCATAEWESQVSETFKNAGFEPPSHHDSKVGFVTQESPLATAAAVVHGEHSSWTQLGKTFSWDSEVLLAPCMIDSSGCGTACLDHDPGMRSVVSRLFRKGAVGFLGNFREGIAAQEQTRVEFWNGVMEGETVGQAFRRALNSKVLTVLDTGQFREGGDHYQLYIATFYGDPALKLHLPSLPRVKPATVEARGSVLRVHAPSEWWRYDIIVPVDWKLWHGKTLYEWRGFGTYPEARWCAEGYNLQDYWVAAEYRTRKKVKDLKQLTTPPEPLGWTGRFFMDEHEDGTRSIRWRVKLIHVDQVKGVVVEKLDHIDYRIQ